MEWNKEGSNAVTRQMPLVEELLLFEDPVANAFQPWLTIVFGYPENPAVLGQRRPRVRNEIGSILRDDLMGHEDVAGPLDCHPYAFAQPGLGQVFLAVDYARRIFSKH